jgi:hypothetical protein
MQLDPVHLIEAAIYSKLINELSEVFKNRNIDIRYIFVSIFLFYLITRINVLDNVKNLIHSNNKISSLTIPGHKKKYTLGGFGQKEVVKVVYSEKFKAITHYLVKNKNKDISSFNEVIKIATTYYEEEEKIEFIMLPEYNQKILICEKDKIYLEIVIQYEEKEYEKKDGEKPKKIVDKNYVYKIFIPENNKYFALEDFIKNCVNEYEFDTVFAKNKQMIFEYLRSHKDEDDRNKLYFREFPFKSNKYLDKNIFFEGKEKFIEYIRRFKIDNTDLSYEKDYENAGVTCKATMLLTGQPGTGKSCTIRGILNETGRHGVLVSWSKIKTCSDFCSIFRLTEINNKKYELNKLCYIFEDFDANNNGVLKERSQDMGVISNHSSYTIVNDSDTSDDSHDINKIVKTKLDEVNKLMKITNKIDDELTLECVLNVLDGIIELHGAMVIFTTNHLEHIDPAFFRSGRIDYRHEFKLATVSIIKEMLGKIRNIDTTNPAYIKYFDKMTDYTLSPADIQTACFKYTKNDAEMILNEIVELCKSKNVKK